MFQLYYLSLCYSCTISNTWIEATNAEQPSVSTSVGTFLDSLRGSCDVKHNEQCIDDILNPAIVIILGWIPEFSFCVRNYF